MQAKTKLELSGYDYTMLSEALRATLTLSQFDQMLKQRMDVNREDISLGSDYMAIVYKVIDNCNRKGQVYRLVNAARSERPNDPTFVEYARLLGIGVRGLPEQAQLESIVQKSNTLLDIATFRSRIGELEGQVCRVERRGEGCGTGFLVGPDAVLTNYHVIESAVTGQGAIEDFACRFDFKMSEGGTTLSNGIVVGVRRLLHYSPYDEVADLRRDGAEPDPAKLDYALLILNGEPGRQPVGAVSSDASTPVRGWIKWQLAAHDFAPGSPLFIVQHPSAQPMKVALDTDAVIGLNSQRTRVTYTTNTERGSSGSPCFTQNWNLVALHHSGDPNWQPTWNEGIPIALVAQDLQRRGFTQDT